MRCDASRRVFDCLYQALAGGKVVADTTAMAGLLARGRVVPSLLLSPQSAAGWTFLGPGLELNSEQRLHKVSLGRVSAARP